MYRPLVDYLKLIKNQLKGLPAEERELQMQEIAQHLHGLIADEMANGLSEADAVLAAIEDFGEPKDIGRGIRAATGGTKTGLWQGMAMGACVGLAILQFLQVLPLGMGLRYGSLTLSFVNLTYQTGNAALSGALASLVGRRFTWRRLTRPSGRLPILGNMTRDVAVCCRFFEVGMFRGGVGGALYGFFDCVGDISASLTQWNTQFPRHPAGLIFFLHRLESLPTQMSIGAVEGAFLVGTLNAVVGLGLRSKEKREGHRRQLT